MEEHGNTRSKSKVPWPALLIGGLLVVYGVVAYTATERHSPGVDEPIHAAGNHIQRFYGDSRATPEDPPLFSWLSTILHRREDLHVDLQNPQYLNTIDGRRDQSFLANTMYRTPGNDPERYLSRSRIVFTLIGMALGALTATWAWKLGGPAAGVVAAALFAFDPNLIAHGPFVCSDVPHALAYLATCMAAWGLGRRGTVGRIILVGLAIAAAINLKSSGLLLVPVLFILVAYRVWTRREVPWTVAGFTPRTSAGRATTALVTLVAIGLVAWATTWALYGFRFRAAPDPSVHFGLDRAIMAAKLSIAEQADAHGQTVIPPEQQPTPLFARFVGQLHQWRVMPEAWLHGVLLTWATTIVRPSYLLGERTLDGWWYYFPFSMLVKLPLATLAAVVLAIVAWVVKHAITEDEDSKEDRQPPARKKAGELSRWDVACLLAPVAVYGWVSIRSSTNLGIRHLFPVMPFLYVTVGVMLARLLRMFARPKLVGGIFAAMGLILAVETLSVYPSYVSYFNVAAGGSRGGLELLSDSSLDWGQGLKHLAAWQKKHPDETLYLSYFGTAYPPYYGIHALPMGKGYPFDPKDQSELGPGVLAISATYVQGIGVYWPPTNPRAKLPKQQPIEVLDGCIYLYRWPPPPGETGGRYVR